MPRFSFSRVSPSDSSSSVLEEGNNDVDEENDEVEAIFFPSLSTATASAFVMMMFTAAVEIDEGSNASFGELTEKKTPDFFVVPSFFASRLLLIEVGASPSVSVTVTGPKTFAPARIDLDDDR